MPITPDQARIKRTTQITYDTDYLTNQIDHYLSSAQPTADGEWFYDVTNVPSLILAAVRLQYEQTGWVVRIAMDRNDTALVFRERKLPDNPSMSYRP